uniref:Uncharacterized protein n=1 Tax=Arion vulgaris TaxID=1028688 RepID=A0A0B7ALC6_9EUPU
MYLRKSQLKRGEKESNLWESSKEQRISTHTTHVYRHHITPKGDPKLTVVIWNVNMYEPLILIITPLSHKIDE